MLKPRLYRLASSASLLALLAVVLEAGRKWG
jgi:hypothetical protein